MRGVGNDLRTPAHAVLPDSAEAEAALTAEADCLYVSLSGAGPTSYGLFPDASVRRRGGRPPARAPSALVDRRHHPRRLADQQKKQLRQAVAASLICPLMIFEYSPSLPLKRSHTAFLASGWPCSVSHCLR